MPVAKRIGFLVIDCDIVQRDRLGVVFLNVCAPTEDTLDYSQEVFVKIYSMYSFSSQNIFFYGISLQK